MMRKLLFAAAVALLISSCVAPDTRHRIVVSIPEQRLALLDNGALLARHSALRDCRSQRPRDDSRCAAFRGGVDGARPWRDDRRVIPVIVAAALQFHQGSFPSCSCAELRESNARSASTMMRTSSSKRTFG